MQVDYQKIVIWIVVGALTLPIAGYFAYKLIKEVNQNQAVTETKVQGEDLTKNVDDKKATGAPNLLENKRKEVLSYSKKVIPIFNAIDAAFEDLNSIPTDGTDGSISRLRTAATSLAEEFGRYKEQLGSLMPPKEFASARQLLLQALGDYINGFLLWADVYNNLFDEATATKKETAQTLTDRGNAEYKSARREFTSVLDQYR